MIRVMLPICPTIHYIYFPFSGNPLFDQCQTLLLYFHWPPRQTAHHVPLIMLEFSVFDLLLLPIWSMLSFTNNLRHFVGKLYQRLYSLRRRLRFVMGIPIPETRRLLANSCPGCKNRTKFIACELKRSIKYIWLGPPKFRSFQNYFSDTLISLPGAS